MANDPSPRSQPRDFYYASNDGLKLFARDYGDLTSPWLPVVCLPGLSRTSRDFHALGTYLAAHHERPRRVAAFDYRGRGRSEWDNNIANYNVATEMIDVLDGMAAMGIPRAAVVGTSRGGIIGMLMALARPQTVAALVLNDIGPFIEPGGLARLKTYIGRTPHAESWADAAHIQRRLHGGQFTALDDADWETFARLTYRDAGGRPASDYDPRLSETLKDVEIDQPSPGIWDEFAALKWLPILAIRGANSDILGTATLERMQREHPAMETVLVADEGHPPQLVPGPLLARIAAFIAAAEDAGVTLAAPPPSPGDDAAPAEDTTASG